MENLKKIFYHYLIGISFSASIVILIIIFDYFLNGYFACPELLNFIKVCLISGVGFGLTHYASIKFYQS
jgi:NhaP-type Na+/H+ and K+/H+ antiporter